MGWSGYTLRISVSVDAHAGEKEERGEKLYSELVADLAKICEDPKYNNDAISVIF
jgi:hypothetical protein